MRWLMLASTNTLRPLPETVDWEKFGWLMGIPKDQREHFMWWLMRSIKTNRRRVILMVDGERTFRGMAEWKASVSSRERRRRSSLNGGVATAGRAFINALEQRDSLSDREMAEAVSRYLDDVKVPKRGAPKRSDHFLEFLDQVVVFAYSLGGSVTFNRRTGKGNIVDLLDELRPLMLEGFIPTALPMSAIERISARARKLMDGVPSDIVIPFLADLREELMSTREDDDVCPNCGQPLDA